DVADAFARSVLVAGEVDGVLASLFPISEKCVKSGKPEIWYRQVKIVDLRGWTLMIPRLDDYIYNSE
ncbi:hypothetical protein F441_10755, partial [Phytophthora nicotianae CJ01A1]